MGFVRSAFGQTTEGLARKTAVKAGCVVPRKIVNAGKCLIFHQLLNGHIMATNDENIIEGEI
jgi:hypothetical protein